MCRKGFLLFTLLIYLSLEAGHCLAVMTALLVVVSSPVNERKAQPLNVLQRFSTNVHSVDLPVIRGRSLFVVVMTAHLAVVSTPRVNAPQAQPLNVLQRFSTVDLPVTIGRSLFSCDDSTFSGCVYIT